MEYFVFGSNSLGIHGSGSARAAFDYYNAVWGVGKGFTGNAYALRTKHSPQECMNLNEVMLEVNDFIKDAELTPNDTFKVTRVGTNLAGFTDAQIAPLFVKAPGNCFFDTAWEKYLPATAKFWGTF
jgi:hypothetical protein